MEIPKSAAGAVRRFEALVPEGPTVSTKKMFGQPAAFVNGNLFFGGYGDRVFVRLSTPDLTAAAKIGGFRPFEPMPGRAMSGYLVLPDALFKDTAGARAWVDRSMRFAATLPPKQPQPRTRKPR